MGALAACSDQQDPAGQAGRADGSDPPTAAAWPAPDEVAERVAQAGLDLGPMGTAEHYHPHLRIVVDGEDVAVAPDIGVDPATGQMSAVHTHEGDGTIHIEARSVGEAFTLGQLFTQWGVELSPGGIGDLRAAEGETVIVTADGAEVPGDPNDLRLAPEQEIVVSLTTQPGS